jgi:hypothetical protein
VLDARHKGVPAARPRHAIDADATAPLFALPGSDAPHLVRP